MEVGRVRDTKHTYDTNTHHTTQQPERSASAVSGGPPNATPPNNTSASGAQPAPPTYNGHHTSSNNHELLPQRLDAIAKLLDMQESHQQQQRTKLTALYTSLATLRTQLTDRNDVIERQSVRLRGLAGQVAAMEAAKSHYDTLLEHKDNELQRLQEQLAVKDAETAAAVAYTARLEQDVQRLTATAASMQAELDGATTEPARIGLKRKLSEPHSEPPAAAPRPAAPRASPRTRTSGTPASGNTSPSKTRHVPRELAALQAAPGGSPSPRGPRLSSGGRAHAAALADKGRARALAVARKPTAVGTGKQPKTTPPPKATPTTAPPQAASITQKQRARGGRAAADPNTWWDLAEIAPGNIVCVRCSRPDQYSLRLPGKQERFVWICSVTKIRGTTIYGRWYHNTQRNLSLPFRLGPELKVPVRIKGRQDILHIYEEDKDFVLSKTEVEELVAEYTHSLTLAFGDASDSESSEEA